MIFFSILIQCCHKKVVNGKIDVSMKAWAAAAAPNVANSQQPFMKICENKTSCHSIESRLNDKYCKIGLFGNLIILNPKQCSALFQQVFIACRYSTFQNTSMQAYESLSIITAVNFCPQAIFIYASQLRLTEKQHCNTTK